MNLATGETAEGWLGHSSLLAEMGTIQLEFRQLSHYTHDNKYAEAADHVSHLLEAMHPPHGLWPVYIDRSSGQFTGERLVTFGGMGDSMYEYLLKGWLQTGKKEEWLWEMYRKSMDGARKRAVPVLSCPFPCGFCPCLEAAERARGLSQACTRSCCRRLAAVRRGLSPTLPTRKARGSTIGWTTSPASCPGCSRW